MNMKITKALRQCALLLWCDVLLTQKHHLMAQHCMVKLFKLIIT